MRTFIITLLLLIGFQLSINAQDKYEIRATWLTTLGGMDWPHHKAQSLISIEKQKKELCDILDRLKQANFNTILFQTRLRGDVIYPSSIETFSESLTGRTGANPGYDPLQFAIDECHKRGMELHAWIVSIPVGNVRQVKLLGSKSVVSRKRRICKLYDGNWYLDPGNPESKDYLVGIIDEVVRRYDIDGIHLDYIRYPEKAEGFPDRDTFRKYGSGKSIKQWRRDNVTAIVEAIYKDIKKQKPWVKLSSSPVGKYRDTNRFTSRGWNAYDAVYQDAQKWLKDGIHDIIFPMMYFSGNNFYPFALDWKENCGDRLVVPGLGIYFMSPKEKDWPLDEIYRQIKFIRKYNLNGQAYFRTKFLLDDTKYLLSELKEEIYSSPALIPPMTWMSSAKPSKPVNGQIEMIGDNIRMAWSAPINAADGKMRYNLYGSNTYPVDVTSGDNLIDTYIQETCYNFAPLFPWRSKVYFAVTSVDCYGNESLPLALNEPLKF